MNLWCPAGVCGVVALKQGGLTLFGCVYTVCELHVTTSASEQVNAAQEVKVTWGP